MLTNKKKGNNKGLCYNNSMKTQENIEDIEQCTIENSERNSRKNNH